MKPAATPKTPRTAPSTGARTESATGIALSTLACALLLSGCESQTYGGKAPRAPRPAVAPAVPAPPPPTLPVEPTSPIEIPAKP